MATMITDECINCGACQPECPNTAIYQGGIEYDWQGQKHAALSNEIFYIVPEKCTECVGFYDHEASAAVCPVDCCVPNPSIPDTHDVLPARAAATHPDTTCPCDSPPGPNKHGQAPAGSRQGGAGAGGQDRKGREGGGGPAAAAPRTQRAVPRRAADRFRRGGRAGPLGRAAARAAGRSDRGRAAPAAARRAPCQDQ